ncbi:alpha/beta hydrolase [Stigmatella sp. ncwal1]|uniref:Alpha/beta hydrolase n=1 Tax=Stigmatella ashevillensis TaxID=2995309 RepID=A0ABT5D0R2_9BACT|nr:alpha/beta hydrolase [Stigmatella ashevillena]MDC0707166.1 alpha/beta hydrolase [Stigmatella ashevillena]
MKVAANGININVTQEGSGDTTLVFLHYWGGSSLAWSQVISRLSSTFRCVALDGRGQGGSDAPRDGYSAVDLADDVLGVVRELEIDNYVVIGHSMGGKTAQVVASRRPAGLRGIALIASSPPSPMPIGDEQRAQMKMAYANRDSVNWTLDNVLIGSPTSSQAREQAVVDALGVSQPAVLGWIDTGTREDFSREVASIDVPTVIVTGELDRVDPIDVVRGHIVPHFKDAPLHVIPGRGHLLPIEAPGEIADILREFAAGL